MAQKFFYNHVYNTKRTITNIIIIGACIIGVIICFIITANFQGEDESFSEGELYLKKETTIEVNEDYTTEIFFSKIENVDLSKIKVSYPANFDKAKPGTYEITLNIDNKNYTTNLVIVDTTKPVLALKEYTITPNSSYTANDFVQNCTDNSKKSCQIEFYQNGVDEEGNSVDYSKYKEEGTYPIKISAKDEAGNEIIVETKLNIKKNAQTVTPEEPEDPTQPEQPVQCKYGDLEYDKELYPIVAVMVGSNGCAVSLNLYKDETTMAELNKLMDTETLKLQRDFSALNLEEVPALNRNVPVVVNKSGSGVVGYALQMIVTVVHNGEEIITEYYVNSEGKRVFVQNPYNLPN